MPKITPKTLLNNKKTTLDILKKSNSCNVSDALKNLYEDNGVIPDIKPIDSTYKVYGKIKTAHTSSIDWGTCIKAIYETKKDEILFINCSNNDYAVWGELASTAAKKHGLKATVINGASRDSEDIRKLGYKVFSKEIKSNAGYPLNHGSITNKIRIGQRTIKDGDIIVADCDGAVVIPQEKLEETLEELKNIKEMEEKLLKDLDNDKQLDELLNLE